MSKSKYGKKVLKTVIKHRRCGTCTWWKRYRPGQKIRQHNRFHNDRGSACSMETKSGVEGVQEFLREGVDIEYLEGDSDNTIISQLI